MFKSNGLNDPLKKNIQLFLLDNLGHTQYKDSLVAGTIDVLFICCELPKVVWSWIASKANK